jgi:hypothetical protein
LVVNAEFAIIQYLISYSSSKTGLESWKQRRNLVVDPFDLRVEMKSFLSQTWIVPTGTHRSGAAVPGWAGATRAATGARV